MSTDYMGTAEAPPATQGVASSPRFRVLTPSLGTVAARLAVNAKAEFAISIETTARHLPGAFLPLTLVDAATNEEIALICSVRAVVAAADGTQAGLELMITNADPVRTRQLRSWINAAEFASASPDLSDLIVDTVISPEAKKAAVSASNAAARARYDQCLEQAAADEKAGRIPEAITHCEDALAVYPIEAARLHLRIGSMALDSLQDVDGALRHAKAALGLAPESHEAARLLERINAIRTENQRTRSISLAAPSRFSAGRQTMVSAALTVVLLAIGSWMVWRYGFPHGTPPTTVTLAAITALVPARSARVYNETLFVTATEDWTRLTPERKTNAMKSLAKLAAERYRAARVVVADSAPIVLAIAKDGNVTVYK
jgi:tetratricopeptide (TPR) repeat protein